MNHSSPLSGASGPSSGPAHADFKLVTGAAGQPLLYSLEAEAYLLACCFIDSREVVARCLRARLEPAAFYEAKHATVYEKILDLHRRGIVVEVAVVAEELKKSGQLEELGSYAFLAEISGGVATTLQAGYFIEQVRTLHQLRWALRESDRLAREARAWSGQPLHEFFAKYAAKWQKAAAHAQSRAHRTMRDVAVAASAKIQAMLAGTVDKSRWLYSGIHNVDTKLLPFDANNEDWYCVLAGLRSQGKSALARQWCVSQFEAGKRGIVFTLETGDIGWTIKAAGVHAQVDLLHLDQELPEKIAKFVARGIEQEAWMGERMWVFEDIWSIEGIEAKTREIDQMLRAREMELGVPEDQARGLDFIMVDYLQQVTTGKKCRTREEEVADVSARLRRQGKTLNITQLILVQLGRKAEERGGPPRLSDLRESAAIEQDAVRVWVLELPAEGRDKIAQDANTETPLMRIWQLKHRNGPTGGVEVIFKKKHTRFEDANPRDDRPRPGSPRPKGGYKRNGS